MWAFGVAGGHNFEPRTHPGILFCSLACLPPRYLCAPEQSMDLASLACVQPRGKKGILSSQVLSSRHNRSGSISSVGTSASATKRASAPGPSGALHALSLGRGISQELDDSNDGDALDESGSTYRGSEIGASGSIFGSEVRASARVLDVLNYRLECYLRRLSR